MPFIANINKDFIIKDDRIILTSEYFKKMQNRFKKITGTKLGQTLGQSDYLNQKNDNSDSCVSYFKVWGDIVGIYKEEMDPTPLEAGKVIEPIIRTYVEKLLNIRFKTYDPFSVKFDVFKENPIFGGIPDGEQIDSKNQFMYDNDGILLEIKTASKDKLVYKKNSRNVMMLQKDSNNKPLVDKVDYKINTWFPDGLDNFPKIPIEYQAQIQLYMYLRHAKKALLAVAFLEPEDYINNSISFNPDNRIIKLIYLTFDETEFAKNIEDATKWYNQYVKKGISPKLTPKDKLEIEEMLKRNDK